MLVGLINFNLEELSIYIKPYMHVCYFSALTNSSFGVVFCSIPCDFEPPRTMSSTKIINKTTKALKLKVGNNLVFTDLWVVEKNEDYTVHIDTNATYQEYYMGMDRNGNLLIINSDECADNQSITIKEDANGTYVVDKVARGSFAMTANPNRAGPKRFGSWISKFWAK